MLGRTIKYTMHGNYVKLRFFMGSCGTIKKLKENLNGLSYPKYLKVFSDQVVLFSINSMAQDTNGWTQWLNVLSINSMAQDTNGWTQFVYFNTVCITTNLEPLALLVVWRKKRFSLSSGSVSKAWKSKGCNLHVDVNCTSPQVIMLEKLLAPLFTLLCSC